MNETVSTTALARTIHDYPRLQARTQHFSCGAPHAAQVIGDGTRALFLRSDGPETSQTSLWLSVIRAGSVEADTAGGQHHEVLLADPSALLANGDDERVPTAERERRERARERGSGIVSYSVDDAGRRVVFTINGQLFLTLIDEDGNGGQTRQLIAGTDERHAPVLNPRISPDGRHVAYTTGTRLIIVDLPPCHAGSDADGTKTHTAWRSGDDGGESPAETGESRILVVACANPHLRGEADTRTADAHHHGESRGVNAPGTAEEPGGTWSIGLAEFVAGEEMDRYEGFWWSPDSAQLLFERFDSSSEPVWYISDPANPQNPATGRHYPRALTRNADVHLHLADLDVDDGQCCRGARTREVQWDRAGYEYLASVHWSAGRNPLILVQNRRQTRDQVLEVRADTARGASEGPGSSIVVTQVREEHANAQWLDIIAGTPCFTPDGRVICAFNDMDADTNRLTVDGRPFTRPGWQVREVLDVTDGDVLVVAQRTPLPSHEGTLGPWRDEADLHDARSFDVVSIDYDGNVSPVSSRPGVCTASRAGKGMVLSSRSMRSPKVAMWHSVEMPKASDGFDAFGEPVMASDSVHAPIENHAEEPGFIPNTTFVRLGEHQLHTAITAPSAASPFADAATLPVLLKPYGGPGFQQVVFSQAAYWDAQWWADQGFLVVTADGRGTTGRGPRWDREIFKHLKEISLADQIEAVRALPQAEPRADLDRVAMIGWSYGGFLSALSVLEAPDVVHAACAGAPPTDWTLYDTHYTERYLGLDDETYRANSLIEDAAKLRRPLMLIHGFADDNVSIANSLRLSQALMAAGRPHTFLPLTGITHMTSDETVAENLLLLQRDFLISALGLSAPDPC